MDWKTKLTVYTQYTERALDRYLTAPEQIAYRTLTAQTDTAMTKAALPCKHTAIYDAARYSAFAGGKRLRPALLLAFYEMFGGKAEHAAPFAAALEMVHTYSLIHDDLPCMDDDDFRRGKPTNHKMFGENIAVLAGDALLNRAFETVLDKAHQSHFRAETILQCAAVLSRASGMDGMIGGQIMDLQAEHKILTAEELILLQQLKTGALIRAAVEMGCVLAEVTDPQSLEQARLYADAIGLSFQIEDDLLDIEGDAATVGKTLGKDEKSGKSTFPALFGVEKCRAIIADLTELAKQTAQTFPNAEFLTALSAYLSVRKK